MIEACCFIVKRLSMNFSVHLKKRAADEVSPLISGCKR